MFSSIRIRIRIKGLDTDLDLNRFDLNFKKKHKSSIKIVLFCIKLPYEAMQKGGILELFFNITNQIILLTIY